MKGIKVNKNFILAAFFTAVIAICSQIAVPMPASVAITFQTFAVSLVGFTLGSKWGLASVFTYILIGAVGLPVFSGFQGGIQVIFGISGGFIIGFIPLSLLCGLSNRLKRNLLKILLGIVGIILCHILGVLQFAFVYKTDLISAFILSSAPYILKDTICLSVAFFLSDKIKKHIA